MAKVSELGNDELVKIYVQIRDKRAGRKKEFEAADAEDKSKQEKIEGIFLARFKADGSESVRTTYGTAFKSRVNYASVADWDTLLEHVKEKDAWELLTHGVNKAAVKQHIEANADVPPGVNWREEIEIRVTRA